MANGQPACLSTRNDLAPLLRVHSEQLALISDIVPDASLAVDGSDDRFADHRHRSVLCFALAHRMARPLQTRSILAVPGNSRAPIERLVLNISFAEPPSDRREISRDDFVPA